MASLDTNVLLRFALGDVPEQFDRARALLTEPDTTYVVGDVAWMEIAYVLQAHYLMERREIADIIETLVGMPNIRTENDFLPSVCAVFMSHPALSFEDCYLVEYAQRKGAAPFYTFDKKLANQHVGAVLVP